MQDDLYNDCETVVPNLPQKSGLEDKPIMKLFKCLINNNSKENTVLTNAQILELLREEFEINPENLHELEVDIYVSIVKRFLKEWPKWDEFEPVIQKLREQGESSNENLSEYLQSKYVQLKDYLNSMLEYAQQPAAKEKIKDVEEKFPKYEPSTEEEVSDVLLEIACSRRQLNSLFYRFPNPKQNHTIFNSPAEPTRITLDVPNYEAILNWWNVKITIKLSCIQLTRYTKHESKFTLINKKLNHKTEVEELSPYFLEKRLPSTKTIVQPGTSLYKKNFCMDISSMLISIMEHLKQSKCPENWMILFSVILNDFKDFDGDNLEEQIWYRKYYSMYPYVRYLYQEIAADATTSKMYDLHLEEIVSPLYEIHVGKIDMSKLNLRSIESDVKNPKSCTIQLECTVCSLSFSGATMVEQFKQHVWSNHFDEPDWHCMKCGKVFSMIHLASNHWSHVCV